MPSKRGAPVKPGKPSPPKAKPHQPVPRAPDWLFADGAYRTSMTFTKQELDHLITCVSEFERPGDDTLALLGRLEDRYDAHPQITLPGVK